MTHPRVTVTDILHEEDIGTPRQLMLDRMSIFEFSYGHPRHSPPNTLDDCKLHRVARIVGIVPCVDTSLIKCRRIVRQSITIIRVAPFPLPTPITHASVLRLSAFSVPTLILSKFLLDLNWSPTL